MKKVLSIIIALFITVGVLCSIPAVAKAEPSDSPSPSASTPVENVNLSIEGYTPTSLASGGDITIKIEITNSGDAIDSAKLTIGGQTVADYGTIASGGNKTYNSTYTVSSSQLDTDIAVVLSYNFGGTSKSITRTFKVSKQAANVKVSTVVKADNTTVASGSKVAFTFAIENQGNVAIENATVTASELNGGKALSSAFSVAPGDSTIVPYTATITETTVVEPVLKYTANGKNYTKNMEAVTITVNEVVASVTVTADNTKPKAGDKVSFGIAIVNSGNVNLTDLVLKDSNGNTVPLGSTKLAVNGTLNATYAVAFEKNTQYSFTLTGKDPSETDCTFTSNVISIEIPEEEVDYASELTLQVSADTDAKKSEDKVIFTITLNNTGTHTFKDVTISENTLGNINTDEISTFAPGTKDFTAEAEVKTNTTYYFKVQATDPDGNVLNIAANPIEVAVNKGASSNGIATLLWVVGVIVLLMIAAGVTLIILVRKDRVSQRSMASGSRITRKPPTSMNPSGSSAGMAGAASIRPRTPRAETNVEPKSAAADAKRIETFDIEEEEGIPSEDDFSQPPVRKKAPPAPPKKIVKPSEDDFVDRNNF